MRSILPILKLTWTEVQYWMVGLSPEGYHASMAHAWEQLGNYRRAAKHFAGYLENCENAHVRAMLAWCHTQNGSWAEAEKEYTRVLSVWKHPSLELGLAETYFELGAAEKAWTLVESVERQANSIEPALRDELIHLKRKMGARASAE